MNKLMMNPREIAEAYILRIPEGIIGKMSYGKELTDKERDIVNSKGKEYVMPHKRNGDWVKPHLRDFDGGKKQRKTSGGMIYTILEEKKTVYGKGYEPSSIVLLHLPNNRVTPYSTHIHVKPRDRDNYLISGNYFRDLEEAVSDFKGRKLR